MPAIITPPDTERRRRSDVDEGDHGGGRRPPTDKQTGGGGDPDNWNGRRGPKSPRERLQRLRLGLFFVLSAVFMFFVAVVSVFFVSQGSGHFVDANARFINEWLPTAIPPILWLDTALLLLSSLTIEIARRHMFREVHVMDEWLGLGKPTSKRAMPWVAATIVLGTLFVVGQLMAWHQLAAQRVRMNTSPSLQSFYLITGVHGFHLVLGVLALVGAFAGLFLSRQMESRQIYVDLAAWYWHSMGVLWLALFALLVFAQ